MKLLTKDTIVAQVRSRAWGVAKKASNKYGGQYETTPNLLLSIYAIESFYRPFYLRICEYCVVLLGCIRCLIKKVPIKNYTIGKCQLGLSTILNFYGAHHYQHSHTILISTMREVCQIFSVLSTDRSIEILAFRLKPIASTAQKIYPNVQRKCIQYMGEQYNGRYSYGMLLTDIYNQLEMVV